MHSIKLTFAVLLISVAAFADGRKQAPAIPPEVHFSISAPEGWVEDAKAGHGQGASLVVYPKGTTWVDAPSVMYVSRFDKSPSHGMTLQKIVSTDVNDFKVRMKAAVKDEKPMSLGKGKTAVVKHFVTQGTYEAIAYIDEAPAVMVLALSAKSEKAFNDSLEAFKAFVSSYEVETSK